MDIIDAKYKTLSIKYINPFGVRFKLSQRHQMFLQNIEFIVCFFYRPDVPLGHFFFRPVGTFGW